MKKSEAKVLANILRPHGYSVVSTKDLNELREHHAMLQKLYRKSIKKLGVQFG